MLHMKYHLQFWVPCCKKDAELLQDMQKEKKKKKSIKGLEIYVE